MKINSLLFTRRINGLLILSALFGSTLLSTSAFAHTQWLKPSVFNTALNGGSVWLSGQLSTSEYAFSPERGLVTSQLLVITPTGEAQTITEVFAGHTASVFDVELKQAGTYKIEAFSGPDIRQARKPKKPDGKAMPAMKMVSRFTTFITADAPNDQALKAVGQWLEIIPVTHPADIVSQESAQFQVLYNGKPQVNHAVTLVASGGEYRNQNTDQEFQTDEQGFITLTPSSAGVYLLKASYSETLVDDAQAQELRVSSALTFEAQVN